MNKSQAEIYGRICFKCGKTMVPSLDIDPMTAVNEIPLKPPLDGTIWESTGNFGSTVWDPINEDDVRLNIIICDNCLINFTERVIYLRRIRETKVIESEIWSKKREK